MGRTNFTDLQCLYSTAITPTPYASYSLYRASVSVQYINNSTVTMSHTSCTLPQIL